MRVYKVPFNFSHEEKIFCGYISLRQMVYLIIGGSSIGIAFVPMIEILIKIKIIMILISVFLLFAFLKIEDINGDKYIINIIRYILRKKIYLYER